MKMEVRYLRVFWQLLNSDQCTPAGQQPWSLVLTEALKTVSCKERSVIAVGSGRGKDCCAGMRAMNLLRVISSQAVRLQDTNTPLLIGLVQTLPKATGRCCIFLPSYSYDRMEKRKEKETSYVKKGKALG